MEDSTNCENGKLYLDKEILAPYTHLLQVGGKSLRMIIHACNHWFRLPDDQLHYIVDTMNMLCIGNLLMDDLQDNSKVRGGLPAAHCIYGMPLTLNSVGYIYYLVMQRIIELGPMAVEIYLEEFVKSIRGRGSELYSRDNFVCPTEEKYKKLASEKTGRILVLAVRLCQLYSEYKTDLSNLVLQLGLYCQIRDDYYNLSEQGASKGNRCCDDMIEGKYSLPIIHALNTQQGEQILNIFRQRSRDVIMKKYCLSLLEKVDSMGHTRDVLSNLDQTAREEVARHGGNPKLEAVLDALLSWQDLRKP